MKKRPYREGDWFSLPLPGGGYGLGLVARASPRSAVLYGYFFGPRRPLPPSLAEAAAYGPADADLQRQFGHAYLMDGRWPVLGRLPQWNKAQWPMPDFFQRQGQGPVYLRVRYPDDNPGSSAEVTRIDEEHARGLPPNVMSGPGAIEDDLARLLPGGTAEPRGATVTAGVGAVDHFLYFPTQRLAETVAVQLREQGYAVDVQEADADWLVRVRHAAASSDEVFEASERLEQCASERGGEYDGFERDVGQ